MKAGFHSVGYTDGLRFQGFAPLSSFIIIGSAPHHYLLFFATKYWEVNALCALRTYRRIRLRVLTEPDRFSSNSEVIARERAQMMR